VINTCNCFSKNRLIDIFWSLKGIALAAVIQLFVFFN